MSAVFRVRQPKHFTRKLCGAAGRHAVLGGGRSPELRYLQLKRRGDIKWQDKVYDALGRQVQDAEALRQVKESSPVLIHTSDSAHADERMFVSRSHGSEPEARAALNELCEAYYAPVMAFLRRVLARALATLEAELRDSGKGFHFDTLKPWLTADADATPQAEAAAKLGISEDASKSPSIAYGSVFVMP
jgi:hypothetical protein